MCASAQSFRHFANQLNETIPVVIQQRCSRDSGQLTPGGV